MIEIDSAHAGTTVRFRVKAYDSSNALCDADSTPEITIYSGELAFSTEVVAATAMTHVGTGTYEYWWDTTGLATNVYRAMIPTTVDGKSNVNYHDVRVLAL